MASMQTFGSAKYVKLLKLILIFNLTAQIRGKIMLIFKHMYIAL